MNLNEFKHIYFLGIGGIGMSALARYFKAKGFKVSGYDKTASKLAKQLQSEGINVHYEDKGTAILSELNVKESLVIYTPAIPKELGEYQAIVSTGFHLIKRAKALGIITQNSKGLGVAGTHGKTTTSTLLAHVLNQSSVGCNAFLGGIASNFESNLVLNETTDLTVIEADEFDQSFLELFPYASIITSTDADHLDIYKNAETLIESFQKYANKTANNGILIREINTQIKAENAITYATNQPELKVDFHCQNIQFNNRKFMFDCRCNGKLWKKIELGIPGIHNASNATAVIALCLAIGLTEMEIRAGLKTFRGVKRRFEYHINKENLVYIDDYAHHPTEINALVSSTRLLYPKQKIVGIFQPHLYSRTNDFFNEFAQALSKLDEVILLPIYAARENPIDGVTSDALLQQIQCSNKQVLSKEATLEHIEITKNKAVYLTIGAGDIDALVEPLKALLL